MEFIKLLTPSLNFEKLRFQRWAFVLLIIAIGIVLYLRQYSVNFPLWIDETMVSLSIIKLPMAGFLRQPMAEVQAAPFGFLAVEKISISLLGISEYSLRLFPFICGILSLGLFYLMAKNFLHRNFVAIALFCYVINPELVRYSAEVKPYMGDVFFVLLAYVAISSALLEEIHLGKMIMISLGGAVMLWFSFPVVFVLAGMASTGLLSAGMNKEWSKFSKVAGISFLWLLSFLLLYVVILKNIVRVQSPISFWQSGYISFVNVKSWGDVFNDILRYPMGFGRYPWLAGLLFLIGGYSFLRENIKKFFLLAIPLVFVFLAAGLHKYSCKERLVLFLVPVFLVIIINGVKAVSLRLGKFWLPTALILIGILFSGPFYSSWRHFLKPSPPEDARKIVSYVHDHMRPGDIFAVYGPAYSAMWYYARSQGFSLEGREYRLGKWNANQERLRIDLDKLPRFNRVWVLFSHVSRGGKQPDDDFCINYLLRSGGILLEKVSGNNAKGYLFDLSGFLGAVPR